LPGTRQAKTFFILIQEGGETQLAFTKDQKAEIMAAYKRWIGQSQATFMLEYNKMNMKAIDGARAKIRDSGGEFHVVKNTLFKLVLAEAGMKPVKGSLERSTIVIFAFNDAPAMAKMVGEITNKTEIFKVKSGFLGKQAIAPAQIKALADLPPLPVMRAMLLAVLQAPASRLVRILAEPARSLAAVVKAHVEQNTALGQSAAPSAA
jgi:large subunit ribosomal protein L10